MEEWRILLGEFKKILKKIIFHGCDECEEMGCPNYLLSSYIVYKIGGIFINENNKEAEDILRKLLIGTSDRFKFLVICSLQEAVSKGQNLSPETIMELEKIRDNPITQMLYREANNFLKSEKAEFN